MLRRWTVWLVLWVAAGLLTAAPMRADEAGICSSILLKPSPEVPGPSPEDLRALEDELFRRIDRHAREREPEAPIFYRSGPDGVALEVAGLSCGEATPVAEAIAGGYRIELSVSGEALALDMHSVKRASRGSTGDLEVRLTKEAGDWLREMTATNIGGEMAVRIAGMGQVETIEILTEVRSGLIQLRATALPEDLNSDTMLALPVTVDGCVQRCVASYTWMHDGDRYVYKPEE